MEDHPGTLGVDPVWGPETSRRGHGQRLRTTGGRHVAAVFAAEVAAVLVLAAVVFTRRDA